MAKARNKRLLLRQGGKGELEVISVIIITKNSAEKLEDALKSLKGLADEIIICDAQSIDDTRKIAKKYNARIIEQKGQGYADWRNQGLQAAKKEWIFYLDFDERITPELRDEIKQIVKNPQFGAYVIPRKNIILGREMRHGGWWPDYVKRLYKKGNLQGWTGDLHEEPVIAGEFGFLKNPIIHLKHDNLSEMIEKTNKWSEIEARLLLDTNHPRMSWWRFIRIMMTEFWKRMILEKGFLDGTEGIIYALYQVYSRFITYGKLWEMQKGEK